MNSKYFTAKRVALLGILTALVIVLQLFGSVIPMFGVTLNFSLIPIALAGITLGWAGGAIIGFVCGMVVFITTAVFGGEPSTAFLFQTNPVVLTIMCIGKTTFAGLISGVLFSLVSKWNKHFAIVVGAVAIPVINTGIYMLGMVIMKASVAEFLGLTASTAGIVFVAVFTLIWVNFLLEIAITALFTPLLYRVTKILLKQ